MSRTKGARNAKPITVKQVAVRLNADELRRLRKIDPSPSKAIKGWIATLPA